MIKLDDLFDLLVELCRGELAYREKHDKTRADDESVVHFNFSKFLQLKIYTKLNHEELKMT